MTIHSSSQTSSSLYSYFATLLVAHNDIISSKAKGSINWINTEVQHISAKYSGRYETEYVFAYIYLLSKYLQ